MSKAEVPLAPRNPAPSPQSFQEFWPHYLRAHQNPRCRGLHYAGNTLALICLAMLVATGQWWWVLIGTACGYGCAWIGHFLVEANKPAAFRHPLWSFRGDWQMYGLWLTGRLEPHLKAAHELRAL